MLFQCYLGTANGRDTLIKELDQALVQIFCVFFYAYELPSWSSFLCVIHSCIYLFGCTESQLQHVGSFVVACRIQFPENESNLGPAASGAQSLSLCTTREVPFLLILVLILILLLVLIVMMIILHIRRKRDLGRI